MTKRAFTDRQELEIAQRYEAGASTTQLAREFGVAQPTILAAVSRGGVELRPGRVRPKLAGVADEIVALYRAGLTTPEIGERFEATAATVAQTLRRAGVDLSAPGARLRLERLFTAEGYALVWVADDDPFVGMRRSKTGPSRYALEHRLVMARHLGRLLESHETVHHINGDKTDNRIENLQIRNGRHGKGAAHRCLDCGSMNVEAVTIS